MAAADLRRQKATNESVMKSLAESEAREKILQEELAAARTERDASKAAVTKLDLELQKAHMKLQKAREGAETSATECSRAQKALEESLDAARALQK